MKKHRVKPQRVMFDRGGGGKEHADIMRRDGYYVQTVAFGTPTSPEKKRGVTSLVKRKEEDEERYVYKNRRAQMYGVLSRLLNPEGTSLCETKGFGIPVECAEVRKQLSPIPRLLDGEGRLYLPPKRRLNRDSNELTLTEIIGHSPDEADSLALAVYGIFCQPAKPTATAV